MKILTEIIFYKVSGFISLIIISTSYLMLNFNTSVDIVVGLEYLHCLGNLLNKYTFSI